MSSHSRHLRYANNTLRHVHGDTQMSLQMNKKLEEMLLQQQEKNRRLHSFINVKIPDRSSFFPLKNEEALERFLDQTNMNEYDLRRASLVNVILPCVSPKSNLFSTALLKAIFSPEFRRTHSWPPNR